MRCFYIWSVKFKWCLPMVGQFYEESCFVVSISESLGSVEKSIQEWLRHKNNYSYQGTVEVRVQKAEMVGISFLQF